MQAESTKNRRTLSPLQIGLLVAVALLAVAVEVLIVRAYIYSARAAVYFSEARFILSDLANLQRDTLLLQLETNRYFQDPSNGSRGVDLRRSLLRTQMISQSRQARNNPYVLGALNEIGDTLDEYDAQWALVFDGGVPDLDIRLNDILAGLERQVKAAYDREETNFSQATSAALDVQRNAAIILLTLAALVLILGVVLAVSMGRTMRAFRRETIERTKAEEANRQLAETLELRVIERTTELSDTLKQLEDVSRHKSEFMANMSHELRTPLNAIIGYSEMLQEEAEDAHQDGYVSDLQKIGLSGNHLLELVNAVLDFAKIESGQMEIYLEDFSVPQMLIEVAAVVQPLAEKNQSSLVVRCDDSVGQMRADLTKVRQALFNLLSNACKFTKGGTITLASSRSCQNGVDWIRFSVADTGIGISQQQMSRLFKPFSQADSSTTRKYGGTGLGLVLSRDFCRMMGGDITVESEEGKGSTFICILPAVVSPARVESATGTDSELALVIDGDEAAQNETRELLVDAGFRVASSASGEEGIRLARELRPGVITLDVFISGMNAWEVLAGLKSDPELADIRVVMLAGSNRRELGSALVATDFLVKPVDRQSIAGKLDRHHPRQQPCTALVIEDDAANRELVGRMLEQQGWAVLEAEDGSHALERLAQVRPDLILLDLFVSGMDSFEFLEELSGREDWTSLPVVVVIGREIGANGREQLDQQVKRAIERAKERAIDRRSTGTQQVLQAMFGRLSASSREPEAPDQEVREKRFR